MFCKSNFKEVLMKNKRGSETIQLLILIAIFCTITVAVLLSYKQQTENTTQKIANDIRSYETTYIP